MSFNGKLFAESIATAGEDCTAHFTNDALYIDGFATVTIDRLSTRVGGFNHDELFFHWQDEQGNNCSFMPNSESEVKEAISRAPAQLQSHLKEWHFRRRSISIVWISIVSIIVAAVLGSILLWWKYDEALNWITGHISIKNEQVLGDAIFSQIQVDSDFLSEGKAHKVVVEIGTLLSQKSAYEYQWHIAIDPQINAYAIPGGIIIVNSGLLTSIESPDELAAVLAHEIQHIEQRHSLKSMINSMGWAAALLILIGDANIATAVIVHQLGSLYFGREKEEEADTLGLDLLVEHGINPDGMITLMQRFETANSTEVPDWLSSHPSTSDRISRIKEKIKTKACDSCKSLTYNWNDIKTDPLLTDSSE